MNEADASPGGGASPAAPVEPAAANPATAPAPAVSVDQVKSLMTEMLGGFKNALFADMRRAGVLGKEKATETPTPAPATAAASAPVSTGLSAADVEAMLEQERVITRVQFENKLTDAQIKRMKAALKADKPEDVSTWTSTYLADMGLVRQADSNPVPTIQPQPAGAPISDKGSPAPGGVTNWEREYAENPLGMSTAAKALMDAKHGVEKARKMRLEAAQAQAARIRVTTH